MSKIQIVPAENIDVNEFIKSNKKIIGGNNHGRLWIYKRKQVV